MFDEAFTSSLTEWLRMYYGDSSLEIGRAVELTGGLSNETVLVSLDAKVPQVPREIVLRWNRDRGPMAPYDVHRQYKIMVALQATEVPVPATYFFESDTSYIGSEFYGVEYISDGKIPTVGSGRLLSTTDVGKRSRQLNSFAKTLARIHSVDWQTTELDFLNVSTLGNVVSDKINELETTYQRTGLASDDVVKAGISWLRKNQPELESVHLVHGDCTLANYLFTDDEVVAVLDWELSSLSDPLEDIGLYLGQIVMEMADATPERRASEREAILEAYSRHSNRTYDSLHFWEVFYLVRCLIIFSQFESYYHSRTPRYDSIRRELKSQTCQVSTDSEGKVDHARSS